MQNISPEHANLIDPTAPPLPPYVVKPSYGREGLRRLILTIWMTWALDMVKSYQEPHFEYFGCLGTDIVKMDLI